MQVESPVVRQLTELDAVRLRKWAAAGRGGELERVLEEADIVPGPQVDPHVITMYTQFELEDARTGARQVVALCYPPDAEPSTGFISVLSPFGASAIGLPEGAPLRWRTPAGVAEGRIGAVLFQPEASGDYVT